MTYESAASRALQEASAQSLEPVMAVEVVTPEESLGTVIGDLNVAMVTC